MIDFVKLRINTPGLAERLRNRPEFDFTADKVNTDTAEDHTGRREDTVRNLKIVLNESGMVEVTGSLHKFANGGKHNHDAFTHARLYETIQEVSALLDTPPGLLNLHNVEFGVNIDLDTPPLRFLNSILNYRFRMPDVRSFDGKGYLLQWQHRNFIVKVYDKKRQYRLDTNTLRFEVKVMAMAYFTKVEVRTIADLLDRRKLAVLGVLLRDTYEGLMIGEKINTGAMTGPELRIYEKGMNPHFWRDLPNRQRRNYYRKKFEQIIRKYGGRTRETVGELITAKVGSLLKSSDVLSDFHETETIRSITSNIPLEQVKGNMPVMPPNKAQERRCKICGTPIGYRRKNAVFCEKKRCRNTDSNPRNNFKRRVVRSQQQTALFEFREVFRPTHQQVQLLIQLQLYPNNVKVT